MTGAGDTGVHFARRGVRTAFVFREQALARALDACDAVALSTDTRLVPPQDAAEVVRDCVARCRRSGDALYYKKIDSALRGNLGSETAAALSALDCSAALICPAMPRLGRSVVNGTLRIDGRPLHATALGRDVFTPAYSSDVAECFAQHAGLRAGHIGLEDLAAGGDALIRKTRSLLDKGCSALVADAATEDDLMALARLALFSCGSGGRLPRLLPVGSAGLGRALATVLAGPARPERVRPAGPLLGVVGSLNPSALAQMAFALERGFFSLLSFDIDAGLDDPDAELRRVAHAAASAGSGHVLLHGSSRVPEKDMTIESGARVADLYGRMAHALCRERPFASVFATGGSTAMSVAASLGLDTVMLEDELSPGVVLSSCASKDTHVRWFISKAGSFGGEETLALVAEAAGREKEGV